MAKGYVYILTNPSMREVDYIDEKGKKTKVLPVKIGIAKDLEKRLGTLNTSLPENFVHHLSMFCEDAKAAENVLHRYLSAYRMKTSVGGTTEFFACPVEVAIAELRQVQRHLHLKEYQLRKDRLKYRSASANSRKKSQVLKKVALGKEDNESWSGKTQLAKIIAKRGGNEGAYGGILHYFSNFRACSKDSKWRKPLEDAGIKFDEKDMVVDWSTARNPL